MERAAMRSGLVFLVIAGVCTMALAQAPDAPCGYRSHPARSRQRRRCARGRLLRATDELHEGDVISAATWTTLSQALNTRQLFDVLIAVGGYGSTSTLITTAGVQLDENMADFRFPPSLR